MVELLNTLNTRDEIRNVEFDKWDMEDGTEEIDINIYFEDGLVTFTLEERQVKQLKKKGVIPEDF